MEKSYTSNHPAHKGKPRSALVTSLKKPSRAAENARLIAGLVERDPDAAAELFDRFGTHINRRVTRLMGPDSENGDIVQQVYVCIVESIHRLRKPEALASWIDRLIVNTVRNALRYRIRRRHVVFAAEVRDHRSTLGRPDTDLVFRRTLAVLEQMKPDYRIAYVLRFVEEEEHKKIAQICGWSLATTKRKISRAKEVFLKKALRDPLVAAYAKEMNIG